MPQVPIVVPELGSDRIRLSLWHVRTGDRIDEGDRVVELLIPGATVDVAAPAAGLLVERLASPYEAVSPGQKLGVIEADSEID